MVQYVSRVKTQCQSRVLQFRKLKGLAHGEIDGSEVWPTQDISPLVADRIVGGLAKRSDVVPIRDRGIREVGIADHVGVLLEVIPRSGVEHILGVDRVRRTGLGDKNSGRLPTAEQRIRQTRVHQVLALPERQLIHYIALEHLRYVEVRVAVVECRVKGILPGLASAAAAPACGVLLIQEMLPGVIDFETESHTESSLERRLQRIVIRNGVEQSGVNIVVLCVGPEGLGISRSNL